MTSSEFARDKSEPASAAAESDAADAASGTSTQNLLSALLGRMGQSSPTLRETLEAGLKEAPNADGAFSPEEREMLQRMLRFGALRAEDIIATRADIIALEESEPLWELLRMFGEAGVSRIPLFSETLDDP